MSESVRLALALTYLGSLFGMATFLIYKRAPGWGWFLAVVCVVVSTTTIQIDSKPSDATAAARLQVQGVRGK
ncbi:hypothetical protein AL490_019035 [Achromobacter xylosoxidans]|nr:hypothetical protein AL490_019035 [Achromobacter xylosoxidans]